MGDSAIVGYWWVKHAPTGCFIPSVEWGGDKTFSILPKNNNDSSKAILFDAHDSQAIYGASSTVQPASISVQYLIKY